MTSSITNTSSDAELLNSFIENPQSLHKKSNLEQSSSNQHPQFFHLLSKKSENQQNPDLEEKPMPYIPVKNLYLPDQFLDQEEIEQYICGICKHVCDEPVITGCGCQQLYCKICLTYFYMNNKHTCPKCEKSTGEPTLLGVIDNCIKNKKMRCSNFSVKCTWEGKCKDYLQHINYECPKEIINCPNKGCIIKLRREEIPEHLKKCEFIEYICEKCQLRMPIREKLLHKNICLKEIIICPQGCEKELERGDFNLHKQQCEFSIIDCPYSSLGCTDKYKRKFEKEKLKEDLNKHLLLSVEKIKSLYKTSQEYSSKIILLEEEVQNLKASKAKNEEEIKSLIKYKNMVQNLESEVKELKRYKEQNEKERKQKELEKGDNKINITNLVQNDSTSISKEKNNVIEIENGVKNKKDKIDDNSMLVKIPKERNNIQGETSVNKLIAKKRKAEYSSKSIYSNNDNLVIKLKKKSEQEKEAIHKVITQDENIYDLIPMKRDSFITTNNIIESKPPTLNKHHYVFFNKKYDIPKKDDNIYKIKYKLLKETKWLGLGICDRKIVEENNYGFIPKNEKENKKENKKSNIGTYLISTNKTTWNCNNLKQCKMFDTVINRANTEVELILKPRDCELEFKYKDNIITRFTDVRCLKSDCFSPCLIILTNCKVETNFEYPS